MDNYNKNSKLIFTAFICIIITTNIYAQKIKIYSISTSRQTNGDNGYTLDGHRMYSSRFKLLNPINFSSTGIYPKSISIIDAFETTNSLTQISKIVDDNIFFFGSFNKLDPSTQTFTNVEIDSLYKWSKRGGKLIIASGITFVSFDGTMLNTKWGYSWNQKDPSFFIPTFIGNSTSIFNGPFGNVQNANQGAAAQGYFTKIPSNSSILATDYDGNPTLFMDCNTLDLIIADVDGYTDLGGISAGSIINNNQDRFWVNSIVFMDQLQPLPKIVVDSHGELSLNATYNSYQWFENGIPVSTSEVISPNSNSLYTVEVTLNGGCKILTDEHLVLPNVFTPNNDGINDYFKFDEILPNFNVFSISIFNRWGQNVYESNKLTDGWDGQFRGKKCPEGTYYWQLKYFKTNKEKEFQLSGILTLFR